MLLLHRLRHSRFGRAMILVGSDQQAAAAAGISPWTYRVAAFTLAGLFAGVAGALSAPLYYGPPGTLAYSSFVSLVYVAIPVLAGFESLTAVALVAVAFTLIPQIVLDWRLNVFLVGGAGLVIGVLLGPRGLGGLVIDRVDGRRRRPPTGAASRP